MLSALIICPRLLFGILRIPPFVNDKGKDVKSDWLADQWDERGVLGHARVKKGRMKGDDPQIDTAQTPKRFDWRLALQGKIQKIFADSIPNKLGVVRVERFGSKVKVAYLTKNTFLRNQLFLRYYNRSIKAIKRMSFCLVSANIKRS